MEVATDGRGVDQSFKRTILFASWIYCNSVFPRGLLMERNDVPLFIVTQDEQTGARRSAPAGLNFRTYTHAAMKPLSVRMF